jgi:hypothetical protein
VRRRSFLASVGVLAASAGCASTTDPAESTTEERAEPARDPEPTTTREPVTVGASQFADADVPPLGDATAWYHDADADADAFVKPGTERTGFPAAMTFTFVNRTGEPVGCGGWTLYKLVDGDWYRIRGEDRSGVCRQLQSGDIQQWSVYAKNGRPFQVIQDEDGLHFPFLGGGRYAFEAGYALPAGSRVAALFDADGARLPVNPEFEAPIERDGGVVTVTTERWGNDQTANAELVAEPVDAGGRRVIAEQCYQLRFGALKNVFGFAGEGVDRIVVQTSRRAAERAVPTGDSRVSFRGASFSLSVRAP